MSLVCLFLNLVKISALIFYLPGIVAVVVVFAEVWLLSLDVGPR